MTELRKDLPELPRRMRGLPVDARGYPVPWFVEWIDGIPDFRIVKRDAVTDAIRFKKCWICGDRMGRFGAFVIGPMCTVNRLSSEPPSHRECAEFAAKACPFLVRPGAKRREANMTRQKKEAPGNMLLHNPGVAAVWISDRWKPFRVEDGILFDVGQPTEIHWYREGRAATTREILAGIDSGLPALMELAEKEGKRSVQQTNRRVAELKQILQAA